VCNIRYNFLEKVVLAGNPIAFLKESAKVQASKRVLKYKPQREC